MKNQSRTSLTILLSTLFFSLSSTAGTMSLIEDKGLSTLDGNTNLEWLDITLTQGFSVKDVKAILLQSGQQLNGYRYATSTELQNFISNFLETPFVSANTSTFDIKGLRGFTDLLGVTEFTDELSFGNGYLEDFINTPPNELYIVGSTGYDNALFQSGFDSFVEFSEVSDSRNEVIGSYLVRENVSAVPVPAALPLMAAALGIFGIARRSNAAKPA